MSLGEIIRQRRSELGLTQDEVRQRVGISKPYLSNIETGRAENPPSDKVVRDLERALGFENGQLQALADLAWTPLAVRQKQDDMAAELERLRSKLGELGRGGKARPGRGKAAAKAGENLGAAFSSGRVVPVINKVAAGYPHHFTDLEYPASVADEYVRVPDVHDPQAFAARVWGDSMEPRYHPGDIVVFSPNRPARSGDDCFARLTDDNSTTFKRFFSLKKGRIRLAPLNEKYEAQEYEREQINGLWPAVMRIEKLV